MALFDRSVDLLILHYTAPTKNANADLIMFYLFRCYTNEFCTLEITICQVIKKNHQQNTFDQEKPEVISCDVI
jgi:hypothetical protein